MASDPLAAPAVPAAASAPAPARLSASAQGSDLGDGKLTPWPENHLLVDSLRKLPDSDFTPQFTAFLNRCREPRMRDLVLHLLSQIPPEYHKHRDPAASAAKVQELQVQDEHAKAYPWLCHVAYYSHKLFGPDHELTIWSTYGVLRSQEERGNGGPELSTWLIPRLVERWGLDNEHTQCAVRQAALFLAAACDPREHKELARIVTPLAQELTRRGDMGWGYAAVGPVPDEEAYFKHCVMQAKAISMLPAPGVQAPDTRRLIKDMLQRCVAYFESLGNHWLAVVRRVRCLENMACLVMDQEDGPAAAEAVIQKAKRVALRVLGSDHEVTLDMRWLQGSLVSAQGRHMQVRAMTKLVFSHECR